MLTTQVALVPLERQDDAASRTELLWVAAALQTQVTRDFGPIWDVQAVVTPFLSLTDVPPQYLPVILTDESLPRGDHGFHLSADGRPFALVYRGEDWSVTASHELVEMILDPSGTLTAAAPSLADQYGGDGLPGYTPQGVVDYLVEPCDPVEEAEPYKIDGVMVSDFVTPSYYDSFAAAGVRYSFLGSVTQTLQVCDGGYLSWRTHDPQNSVWQAHVPAGGSLTIGRLKDDDAKSKSPAGTPADDFVSRFARDQVAVRTSKRGHTHHPPASAAVRLTNPYATDWEEYGRRLASDIQAVIGYLKEPPPPTLRDVINVLKELKASGAATPPQALLDKYNIPDDSRSLRGGKPADADDIIKLLEKQERIANILDSNAADPNLSSWLCRLMP